MNDYGTEASTLGVFASALSMKWVITESGPQIQWMLEGDQPTGHARLPGRGGASSRL